MNLGELTSLKTCPRCGFSIPIYPSQEFVMCKNCEKKIDLKINDTFEGEKVMNTSTTEIIKCPFCKFRVWVRPNQETAICEHCKTTIDVNLIKSLGTLKGENEMETIKESMMSLEDIDKLLESPTIDELREPITKERLKPDYIDHIRELIQEELNKPLAVNIKYHDSNMPKLKKITKGNWIDCRVIEGGTIARDLGTFKENKQPLRWENKIRQDDDGNSIYTKSIRYKKGDFMMLCLGISLNQGEGYEVNLVPRSGTFKNFHIIQTNHYGIGDDTFVGNGDVYHFPCYALADGEIELYDRVCQMRINKAMGQVNFTEVDDMEAEDRGGFSSTGTK